MTVTPDGGADGTGTRPELIGHRRSLLTRCDARTDAVPLPVAARGAVSAVGVAVQGLIRFVYSLLIGRTLPAGFLSATNSAISTAMLAALLWPTSLGAAAAKFLARESGDLRRRTALTHHLARLTLLTSIPLGAAAGLLTYWVLAPGEVTTAALVALLAVGLSGYTFVRGTQYATGRILRATLWDGLSFLVAIVGLVLVLVLDLRAWLLLPLAVGYILHTVVGWPRSSRGPIEPALRAEVHRFIAWGVVGSLATGGFLQLTMVLAQQTGDAMSADAYAAALTLATPASMVGSVLSLLLLPALSSAVGRADLEAVRRNTDIAHRGLITTVGGIFGVLLVGSRLLVALIWPQLSATVPILEVLLVGTFLLTVSVAVSESLRSYSAHGPRTVALVRGAGLVIGLAVALALLPSMSVIGIAFGYLAGMVITACLPTAMVWRRDHHRWGGLMLRVVLGAALAAGVICLRSLSRSPGWLDLAAVAIFALGWALLHRKDLIAVARRSVRMRSLP